jgi:hypothetical protein
VGHGYAVKLLKLQSGLFQSAIHDRDYRAHMLSRGDFRDNAAILRVHIDLRGDNIGDYVSTIFDDRGGGLVA